MIPPAFDYHAPASIPEAIALLSRFGDSAKVISGGQSLLPLLKLRLGSADHLVDIGRIPGLEYVREEGGFLRIGGRTREAVLERSEVVKSRYPDPASTPRGVIADPLVRNRGHGRAETWRTATPRTTIRRRCSPCAHRWWRRGRKASG